MWCDPTMVSVQTVKTWSILMKTWTVIFTGELHSCKTHWEEARPQTHSKKETEIFLFCWVSGMVFLRGGHIYKQILTSYFRSSFFCLFNFFPWTLIPLRYPKLSVKFWVLGNVEEPGLGGALVNQEAGMSSHLEQNRVWGTVRGEGGTGGECGGWAGLHGHSVLPGYEWKVSWV